MTILPPFKVCLNFGQCVCFHLANAKSKRLYTGQEVLNFIVNDSDYPKFEFGMFNGNSDDRYSEKTVSNRSSIPTTHVQVKTSGKYALAWVLPKIVTQNPEPITRHVPELEAVMEPCGVTECVSLLQVFGMIAKSKPKVLEGHVAAFCNYLTVSTLVPLILAMFVDMATANPAVFIDHVTALKLLAEQQPVFIHQIVKIVGAVGTVSLPHAVRTMGYLVSLLSGLSDQASLVVILQEIKALGLIHHSLLADHMQEISRLSQSGSSSVRILVHQLKDDSKKYSGQKEMRSVSSQTEGTVTIITVGNPAYPSNVVGVRQQQQQQQQQQQVSHSNRSSQLSLTPSSRTSIANSRSLSDRPVSPTSTLDRASLNSALTLNSSSGLPPEPLRDGVQHFCEKHMDTIRKFISSLSARIPLPAKCSILDGRHKRYVRLNFQCGIKGTNCLYGKQFFILNTKLPKTWIHLMFLAVQAQSASALSQQDLSVSSLKHCWDALYPEKGNSGYITLVTSSFPSAKDQDALLQELHGDRYFDVFEFNAPRKY
ncbi:ventricular zone-expressed PH domain-containing protein-like [Mya arenaria]|uniref:ventricular zone-expressed PH domain-containing protein-like n=1 Tax=Mya arenaria TaxID=6604 RepID=UPI0022E64590|nr:ventricular zone-expressed PH domain-containing protein-like [Mya arenaria]